MMPFVAARRKLRPFALSCCPICVAARAVPRCSRYTVRSGPRGRRDVRVGCLHSAACLAHPIDDVCVVRPLVRVERPSDETSHVRSYYVRRVKHVPWTMHPLVRVERPFSRGTFVATTSDA